MDSMIKEYMQEENLIAKGSSRDVYRAGSLVIKKHTHVLGYKQSKQEEVIYNSLLNEKWKKYLSKPYYVCEDYAIFDYVKPLQTNALHGCDIGCCDLEETYSPAVQDFEQGGEAGLVSYLKENYEVVVDDLYMTHNIGINETETNFVFLDYGLTKELSEEYDKALQNGEISYYVIECCSACGGDATYKITGDKEELILCEFCGRK